MVNPVPDAPPARQPDAGRRLTLDGGAGADTDVVGLFGTAHLARSTSSTPATTAPPTPSSSTAPRCDDLSCSASGLIGLLSTPNSQGAFTAVEKVTYTDGINGGVVSTALAGDDSFALDDTSTTMLRQRRHRQRPLPDRPALHRNYTVTDPEFAIPAADFFTTSRGR